MTASKMSAAEFRRAWEGPETVAQIAARMGVSLTAVSHRARARGLPPRPTGRVAIGVDLARLRAMWLAMVDRRGMAESLNVTPATMFRVAKKDGLPVTRAKPKMTVTEFEAMIGAAE